MGYTFTPNLPQQKNKQIHPPNPPKPLKTFAIGLDPIAERGVGVVGWWYAGKKPY